MAALTDGVIYDLDGSVAIARLRGAIPGSAVPLEFTGGASGYSLRPILVDVLELRGGRYLVKLASGQEAWVPVGALALGVMALDDEGSCATDSGAGLLIRTSGEPFQFDRCDERDGVVVLETGMGPGAIAKEEVARVLFGEEAMQFVASNLNSETATG